MTDVKSKMSKKAIVLAIVATLAVPFEGLRQYAYYDPPGILTVCYGSTTNVEKGKFYSTEECKARLEKDMSIAFDIVANCTSQLVIPDKSLAALADAAYNIGPKIICDQSASTLARKLAAGDIKGACNELPKWDKAKIAGQYKALPGLTKRRLAEQKLCLEGVNGL